MMSLRINIDYFIVCVSFVFIPRRIGAGSGFYTGLIFDFENQETLERVFLFSTAPNSKHGSPRLPNSSYSLQSVICTW